MSTSRVLGYTPEWLSKPNPGHEIFISGTSAKANVPEQIILNGNKKKEPKPGPRRTIARRGTEIFIAAGNEIRWADLVYLKEAWESQQQTKNKPTDQNDAEERADQYYWDHAQGYRTIQTRIAQEIKQLVISPHSKYLAILTTHTVHILLLPESSCLTSKDSSPLRPKITTLGPTVHVTSQTPLATALWHPLGVNGSCLVTVTEDAVVRVWELSMTDRWSYDRPTLAIDLKKLVDGTLLDQDFTASISTNTGFSPDMFEMEVASACFAARGTGEWSPMTLWIAMREGDVYALCPLLPEKWAPPPELIPSLSVSIVAKVSGIEDDPKQPEPLKLLAQQQLAWLSDLDSQEPIRMEGNLNESPAEVFSRPSKPGKIPKLQGPFKFDLSPEENPDEPDHLLSDIYVIGAKLNVEDLMFGEENDLELEDGVEEGLSISIICLLTSTGRLYIYLDLDGVEARWLPKIKSKALPLALNPTPSLLTFDVLEIAKGDESWSGSWPMFSPDVDSRFSFFVTNTSSITFISLSPWVFRLEKELAGGEEGSNFRLDMIVNSERSIRDRVFTQKPFDFKAPLSASIPIRDPDLGYFLLSTTPHGPISLTFESPEFDSTNPIRRTRSPTYGDSIVGKPLILYEPRPVYQPAYVFEENSSLPSFLEKVNHSKYKRLLGEEVRLSPATLTIMTDAHKLLSEETHRLGTAAAELFRRCEALQIDLKSQVEKTCEVAKRVSAVAGHDYDDYPEGGVNRLTEERIASARERQGDLIKRTDALRRKSNLTKSRPLSDKERRWMAELGHLEARILGSHVSSPSPPHSEQTQNLNQRFEDVKSLSEEVLNEVSQCDESLSESQFQKESQNDDESERNDRDRSRGIKVSTEVRKAKIAKILGLLQRETALVESARLRLEGLGLG